MPGRRFWLATFVGLFAGLGLLAVVYALPTRSPKPYSPATSTSFADAVKQARFISELSSKGLLKSTDAPEAMRIGMAQARGLFRKVPWDEFVVMADPPDLERTWTVRVEPKFGPAHDRVWIKIKDNRVTSFGFHRKSKLMGYTGKSMKGVEPGFGGP
jgi:hypothetical protein